MANKKWSCVWINWIHYDKLKDYLTELENNSDNKTHIAELKKDTFKNRPCILFHKSNDYYWVIPLSTSEKNFDKKFDIWINDKSFAHVCNLTKIHKSFINEKKNEIIISDEVKQQLINKLKWFFNL